MLPKIVKLWAIYNVPLSRSRGRVGSVPVHAARHLPALRLPPRLRRIHASPGMGQDSMQLQSFFCISSEAIVYDAKWYAWIVHWSEGLSLNNLHNYIALLWNYLSIGIALRLYRKLFNPLQILTFYQKYKKVQLNRPLTISTPTLRTTFAPPSPTPHWRTPPLPAAMALTANARWSTMMTELWWTASTAGSTTPLASSPAQSLT